MSSIRDAIKANSIVVKDQTELADLACKFFFDRAVESLEKNSVFRVAFSGGSTPKPFFEALSRAKLPDGFDWSVVHIFWADERCVSPDSLNSNYNLLRENLLSKIQIPASNIHRVKGELSDYQQAADEYSRDIATHFAIGNREFRKFDLICLGVGSDGHIASLFPENKVLNEYDRIASKVYVEGQKIPNRITLTIPLIQAAKSVMVIVKGDDKAKMLKTVLEEKDAREKYPVQNLWQIIDRTTWILDAKCYGVVSC